MTFDSPATGVSRRTVLAALAAAGLLGASRFAQAQSTWKAPGPVKLVIPFAPGGSADIVVRYIAPMLSERFGQPVLVENKPGGTGAIASAYVNAAPADGTTLLVGVADSVSIYPHVAKTSVDVTKFVPVSGICATAFVLLGRPDLPADNLQELVALMKRQDLSFASAGPASSPQMMSIAFARAAKVDHSKMLHVPFNGMAPALQALMGKQVDIMMVAVGGATQYRSRLKFFGVTSEARVSAIPEIPTLTEQGLPVVGEVWIGALAPPHTPAATAAAMAKVIEEVVTSADLQEKVKTLGMRTITLPHAAFAKYYLDEYRRWGELVRVANVKLD
ncbi:MAG TPA: tripartite tricarboxylate transporter substrate binding protein [Ramlibacter sp.]|nr:tripartite tricarboxylate transporter substrate binding protein [Ramlibacter sp.]